MLGVLDSHCSLLAQNFDRVIRHGSVIDGSGSAASGPPPRKVDLAHEDAAGLGLRPGIAMMLLKGVILPVSIYALSPLRSPNSGP
jgi:hypothetical protein